MKDLTGEYSVEVDTVDQTRWDVLIQGFTDVNVYQTWSYGAVVKGSQELSHLLLKKADEICAVAQVRLATIPVIKSGIAYVRWGPLWKKEGTTDDLEIFTSAMRALRKEYSERRGLVTRVLPGPLTTESPHYIETLAQEGFTASRNYRSQKTIMMDITPPLETIRKGLKQKWRNCLNQAEKNGLEVSEGESDDLFGSFLDVYREMHDRKKFVESTDVNQFRLIQANLPKELKMRIFLAFQDGNPCAGAVCSAMGITGVYLFGATSNAGMTSKGAYLLQWKIVEWLKKQGCTAYNLHGIDPLRNPGTYRFKSGLGGQYSREVDLLGQYDTPGNIISTYAVRCGDAARIVHNKIKERLKRTESNERQQ